MIAYRTPLFGLLLCALLFCSCSKEWSPRRGELAAQSSASNAGTIEGSGGDPDQEQPTAQPISGPALFSCTAPQQRGQGDTAMRRLTRTELRRTLEAEVGPDVMGLGAVEEALLHIPAEPPGDLVQHFQPLHALEHAQGLLLLSEAVASGIMNNTQVRDRVLGSCAVAPTEVCAYDFLKNGSLAFTRRPLPEPVMARMMRYFMNAGSDSATLEQLIARVLQQPATTFQLELPHFTCADEPDQSAQVPWNDPAAYYDPIDGEPIETQAEFITPGWFVWEIPAATVSQDFDTVVVEFSLSNLTAKPLFTIMNINDRPVSTDLLLESGTQHLEGSAPLPAGEPVKVGVYFYNVNQERAVSVTSVRLENRACVAASALVTNTDGSAPEGAYRVDSWAVASRLALGLTGQGPDQPLRDAAASGALQTLQQVQSHAERLLSTPAARTHAESLFNSWLLLDTLPTPDPVVASHVGVDPSGLTEEARAELLEYALYQVFDQNAGVASLMSAPTGFPRSERLASLYDAAVAVGPEPVALPAGHGGLLLRIGPLLSGPQDSAPMRRGTFIRQRLLCDALERPETPTLGSRHTALAAIDRAQFTTREALATITAESPCADCHNLFNPLGFALEAYGPLGQWRDLETVLTAEGEVIAQHPLDLLVTDLALEAGGPETLNGPSALLQTLSASAKVHACIAERLYTQARLRSTSPADHCALSAIEQSLRAGTSIRTALLEAVVNPELFLRSANEGASP